MAVRNDFQVGEVLKSEDLNDTFASKRSGNANLLYNGAMQVAQRGTSTASITTGGYYTADRWATEFTTLGTWTQSVENDAPTGSGFRKSLKMLVTTADAAPASADIAVVAQYLEGQDCQRIAKGTASAQQLTASFWVKSNVTGTYVAYLFDADNTRIVSASYSVTASATWEKKVVTFPADATGALDNDNARSLHLTFALAAGSGSTSGTLQTTWGSVGNNYATGQTNLAAATNNYWQVTGVQLEVGPAATPFEFKSFGQELRECQRYYYRGSASSSAFAHFAQGFASSTTSSQQDLKLPVTMRVEPTAVEFLSLRLEDINSAQTVTSLVLSTNSSTPDVATFDVGVASGLTQFRPYFLGANNSTSGYVAVSAEL